MFYTSLSSRENNDQMKAEYNTYHILTFSLISYVAIRDIIVPPTTSEHKIYFWNVKSRLETIRYKKDFKTLKPPGML